METATTKTVKDTRTRIQIASRKHGDVLFRDLKVFQNAVLLDETKHLEGKARNKKMEELRNSNTGVFSFSGVAKRLIQYALDSGVLPHELYK